MLEVIGNPQSTSCHKQDLRLLFGLHIRTATTSTRKSDNRIDDAPTQLLVVEYCRHRLLNTTFSALRSLVIDLYISRSLPLYTKSLPWLSALMFFQHKKYSTPGFFNDFFSFWYHSTIPKSIARGRFQWRRNYIFGKCRTRFSFSTFFFSTVDIGWVARRDRGTGNMI